MSSDDDRDAFADAMRGVKKLRSAPRVPHGRPSRIPRSIAKRRLDSAHDVRSESSLRRSHVPEKALKQLRRGRLRIGAELDLHGMTAAAARTALDAFLAECRARGIECARVIHGKGYRSGPEGPVLRGLVHARLTDAAEVLAFTAAAPHEGGSGATLVLLRR
jgi:DNA-nicking Smr family endonuclease